MRSENNNSKERIKARMLKSANIVWDGNVTDIAAYDPILDILMTSFSGEVEKVYNELFISQARTLERLANLLTPEAHVGPEPSHLILHAQPQDDQLDLDGTTQMYFRKTFQSRESTNRETFQDIYYTPIVKKKTINANVAALATTRSVFEIKHITSKIQVASGIAHDYGTNIFIGIHTEIDLDDLKNLGRLQFYFDWYNNPDRYQYYNYLLLSKAYLGEKQTNWKQGIIDEETSEDQFLRMLLEETDPIKKLESNILRYYSDRFFSMSFESLAEEDFKLEVFPRELVPFYDEIFLKQFKEKLLWIRLEVPPFVPDEFISDMVCSLNCFPVVNKRFNDFPFRIQQSLNVIPLHIENEYFLGINSVKTGNGEDFVAFKSAESNRMNENQYVVRQGGIARFDERDAKQMLDYLIDLVRDESASFSFYGQEILTSHIKQLSQLLGQIEKKVKKTNDYNETVSYLIVKGKDVGENLWIEYWTTNGQFANNIPLGSGFEVHTSEFLQKGSLRSVSVSLGGRDPLTGIDALNSYKSFLVSRSRIISFADIKLFCKKEFGSFVSKTEIVRTHEISSNSKEGFTEVLLIKVTPNVARKDARANLIELCKSVEVKVNQQSTGILPIKVVLEDE